MRTGTDVGSAGFVRRALFPLLAGASGVGGLAYEVLYFRHLTTLLGDLFYVHAALLAVFLTGIGIGARWAHRWPRHLYLIEMIIGAYAIALPFITAAFPFDRIGVLMPDYALRVTALTILFLAVPSVAIGFSVPLFSACAASLRRDRPSFPRVYLLYNAGAAAGVLLVELLVIRWWGITPTLRAVGVLNLVIGATLFAAYRPPAPADAGRPAPHRFAPRVLAALALASFGSAVFQMFYAKLCSQVFGPHRQVFAFCLVLALLGVALGTWLVRRFRMTFAGAVAGGLCWAALAFAFFEPLQRLYWRYTEPALVAEHPVLAWLPATLLGLLLGLGAFSAWGGTIPALLDRETRVETEAGMLLFVSCLANAAGYLFYVFWGQETLPFFAILLVLAVIMMAALLLESGRHGWWRQRVPLLLALPALLWIARLDESQVFLGRWMREATADTRIVHYKHGPDNVTLVDREGDSAIRYNGYPSITVRKSGRLNYAEILSGILPSLGAPRLERAMVLGMGTGLTGGTVARLFQHTDVVEINRAFFDLAGEYPDINFDLMRNPAARVIYDDARIYLAGRQAAYDVVVNSIPAPTFFSAGKVYTAEFYEMVRKALKPDGIFCTWMSAGDFTEAGLPVMLRTLGRSFTYYSLWFMRDEYAFLLCSNSDVPGVVDASRLQFPPAIAGFWQGEFPALPPDELMEAICISQGRFDQLVEASGAVNRDDFPVLEFMVTSLRPRPSAQPGSALLKTFPMLLPPIEEAPSDRLGRRALHAQLHFEPLFRGYYAAVLTMGRPRLEGYADAAYRLFALSENGQRLYQAELDALMQACELNTFLGRRDRAIEGWRRLLAMYPQEPAVLQGLRAAEALPGT
jgi:spermidine synthase